MLSQSGDPMPMSDYCAAPRAVWRLDRSGATPLATRSCKSGLRRSRAAHRAPSRFRAPLRIALAVIPAGPDVPRCHADRFGQQTLDRRPRVLQRLAGGSRMISVRDRQARETVTALLSAASMSAGCQSAVSGLLLLTPFLAFMPILSQNLKYKVFCQAPERAERVGDFVPKVSRLWVVAAKCHAEASPRRPVQLSFRRRPNEPHSSLGCRLSASVAECG